MGLHTCSRMTLAADELPLLSRNSTMDGDANSLEEENEGPASLVKILFPQKKSVNITMYILCLFVEAGVWPPS